MQQTKKFKMADALSPYLAVSCGLISLSYHVVVWIHFNLSPTRAAYMRRWTGLALVQVMAWRRTSAELLSIEPLGTKFSEILIKFQTFSLKEMQ